MKAYIPPKFENYQPDYTALKKCGLNCISESVSQTLHKNKRQPLYKHHTTKVSRLEVQIK